MTITGVPPTAPSPVRPRRRFRWTWLLLLLWPGLPLFAIAQDTWQGMDVYSVGFHGLDTRARDLSGQGWTLKPNSDDANYFVSGLNPDDRVKTWTGVSQNGHMGISTRIDGIADPKGPIDLVDLTVTRDSMGHTYPQNGSPIGTTTALPQTLKPGTDVELNLTWSVSSCHPPGTPPATYSVSTIDLHETALGMHRTRPLPLGFTLHLTEPTCSTR